MLALMPLLAAVMPFMVATRMLTVMPGPERRMRNLKIEVDAARRRYVPRRISVPIEAYFHQVWY
eukprot:71904-Rhodomonas_salina.2